MPLTKFTGATNTIQSLADRPNQDGGLTAAQLKIKFDQFAIDNKAFLNDVMSVEIDTLFTQKTSDLNTHKTSNDHDSRYYTETELDNGSLDGRYYIKSELDPYLRGGDTIIKEEVFTITNSNNGAGGFLYTDKNNIEITGSLDGSGNQIFTLQDGNYELNENRIEATINDTLRRSVASGGLFEIDTTHIKLTDPQGDGAEITFRYFEKIGVIGSGLIIISNTQGPYFWLHD